MPAAARGDNSHDDEDERDHSEEKQEPCTGENAALYVKKACDDGEVQGSDRTLSLSIGEEKGGEDKEFIMINLSEIRREVQCPICLGIIRKTRTVMECLHRFCRECIDKSMRLGNNECPACRTHCASRRSLRDDPNYDTLISALFPDIDNYEKEELTFDEEEIARNKQIQASIGNTVRRQAEALGKKRQRKPSASTGTGKRISRSIELQGLEANDDGNGNGNGFKNESSADEHSGETRPKRSKRFHGNRPTLTHEDDNENDAEVIRESVSPSLDLAGPSKQLSWGKNGVRSHTRHGNANGSNGKAARNHRISKLVDHLKQADEHHEEIHMQIKLFSCDPKSIPSLDRPYLYCKPTLSVKQLLQYVALQTELKSEEMEMLLVKELSAKVESSIFDTTFVSERVALDLQEAKLESLEEQNTLATLPLNLLTRGYLLLGYQKKEEKNFSKSIPLRT